MRLSDERKKKQKADDAKILKVVLEPLEALITSRRMLTRGLKALVKQFGHQDVYRALGHVRTYSTVQAGRRRKAYEHLAPEDD